MPPEFRDDEALLASLAELGAETAYRPWNDATVDWQSFDLVVVKSPWDYTQHHREFLSWAGRVGDRLENAPELIRWNSDKHYLAEIGEAGVAVVRTAYVEPGAAPPPIETEIVVKPTISAGARDTGRFGPASAAAGAALIERITAAGDTAMVQPFLSSVETGGETAVVTFAGEVSHTLRKRPVLRPDEVAPVREGDALGVAEAMYHPDLVDAGTADPAELALAESVLSYVAERFGATPLIARIDMLRDGGGEPVLLELEAIEPNLYFDRAPGAAERLARAIVARAEARKSRQATGGRARPRRGAG
jgi:hypothetical protein